MTFFASSWRGSKREGRALDPNRSDGSPYSAKGEEAVHGATEPASEPILKVDNLQVSFKSRGQVVKVVRGVSFDVQPGETLGLVGESGSGKSVTALSIMGLLPPGGTASGGQILFEGQDLLAGDRTLISRIRGQRVSMVFQNPSSSFNPVVRIGPQVAEIMALHETVPNVDLPRKTARLLSDVGIPDASHRMRSYPHQFSGGMLQRAMIAMAVACEPGLLIADEPTTALDVTVQAQILDLFRRLREELGMAILLITHNLGVVAELADRVAVMYAGRLVELGTTAEVLEDAIHPYTRGLLKAVPRMDSETLMQAIPGSPPDLTLPITGCSFLDRCPFAMEKCSEDPPLMGEGGHLGACWLAAGDLDA